MLRLHTLLLLLQLMLLPHAWHPSCLHFPCCWQILQLLLLEVVLAASQAQASKVRLRKAAYQHNISIIHMRHKAGCVVVV